MNSQFDSICAVIGVLLILAVALPAPFGIITLGVFGLAILFG